MKFIKSFNENSNNLIPYLERMLEITSFNGHTLQYWLDYSDDSATYENIQDVRRAANRIIEEYEESDDGGAPAKNRDMLLQEMIALARILINFRGSVNMGVLSAYCMQKMDVVEWSKSDTLKDLNKKTGIFENADYFKYNNICSLSDLKQQINDDHLLFIEKINEYLKPKGFEMKFVEILKGQVGGGQYIYVRINNIGFVMEGYDHIRPHKNSMEVWEVFEKSKRTQFYDLEDFIEFYKEHNMHLFDMPISKTGIFN